MNTAKVFLAAASLMALSHFAFGQTDGGEPASPVRPCQTPQDVIDLNKDSPLTEFTLDAAQRETAVLVAKLHGMDEDQEISTVEVFEIVGDEDSPVMVGFFEPRDGMECFVGKMPMPHDIWIQIQRSGS